MARSLAFAYSIAGVAVAVAVIVIAGSTTGLLGEDDDDFARETVFAPQQVLPVEGAGMTAGGAIAPAEVQPVVPAGTTSEVVTTASGEQVEYVYVDESARRGDDDHDDDDHDDDDDRARYEREHDNDDHDDDHEDDD